MFRLRPASATASISASVRSYIFFGAPLTGIRIMSELRGYTSGMAIPHFVIDAPGGGGKLPISPQYVLGHEDGRYRVRNYRGDEFTYVDPVETDCTVPYDEVYFAGSEDP